MGAISQANAATSIARRRPAHRQIDRESRERDQAAEQPRRHERTMTGARQRVISCRGMQQRIETIADDTQNSHCSRASACSSDRRAGTPPLIFAPPCQSEIKRTLRLGGRPPNTAHSCRFHASRAIHSTRMVNVWFPARSIYGFEMVDARARTRSAICVSSIKNLRRIKSIAIFREFSPALPQCKHLRFIDGC